MRVLACLIIATLACTSALAQSPDPRRRIYPTQDGFLEVDPRTGAITECKRTPEGYRCERVGESDALLKEEPGPQVQAPAVPPRTPDGTPRLGAPTDQEVDRALDVMERLLRRFRDILREPRPERT
jgi:hypothetical protein